MTDPNESQPTLPGLEDAVVLGQHNGALRNAVVVTLEELKAAGLLERRHAALAQLALELADAVSRGVSSGRASAAAMAAANLRETLLALPAPMEAGVAEKFERLVASLEADVNSRPAT